MKKLIQLSLLFMVQFCLSQNYSFLGSYNYNGTPLYLEPVDDTISPQTMQMIQDIVPESYPVPEYNPHYISSGYDTDIILDEPADVWVTFVQEGAGYKNVLGFYSYDINNPQTTTPTPSEITIIFPNVSASGSGGELVAGNKVKIGSFPANTGIGWVLLADGWDDATSSVTAGNWQLFSNPDFNPEANEKLRYHNVLISDPENERIILGFEDIRRDYNSCDNDFNDALFYVSANPYSALRTSNYADTESANDVSSGNSGGLESNGNLAELIAKRNFTRLKKNTFAHKKSLQQTFVKPLITSRNANTTSNLSNLFPSSGMFGTEEALQSTPIDLLQITNATDVFSVDYYENENRVAAALATKTIGSVYNHSKMICDRLNGSTLEDIRQITLQEHDLVMIKVRRANEEIEYAILFSVTENNQQYNLHSYWNIFQYPMEDYTNFQIWGSTMGQVSHITNHILNEYQDASNLTSNEMLDRIPSVFIKKGTYHHGQITLDIVNKTLDNQLQITANARINELAGETEMANSVSLSGEYEEQITFTTGSLFDINLTLVGNNSPQADALYLADGPWGLDYSENESLITNFEIENNSNYTGNGYAVERNPSVSGDVLGTVNLFRTIMPGELSFNASSFGAIEFNIKNNLPVELILVTNDLSDWSQRFTYQIPANNEFTTYNISFTDFTNSLNESLTTENLKTIVFSTQGNYQNLETFNLAVNQVAFTEETLSVDNDESKNNLKPINYPNPFQTTTTLQFAEETTSAQIRIYDILGRIIYEKEHAVIDRKINLNLASLPSGVYECIAVTNTKDELKLRMMKM
ncbi:DUF4114 domain-containing protein [Mesonia aestuariivivens]|uniref:DUF4114 domain-containing protein n=1 Tax=Mesonia aestuariivivens TaxID=2796128 RepID=A0ABS6W4M1_9FLAO|nr:DUF4114 domain-containing protein [Mesonia aestuariivivens]MBW2962823.1 DUF4114 domain-containing protein [Mesonia aestuariivivens]